MSDPLPTQRSWLEVQWRKARNPPPPVLRAVLANLTVAAIGGVALFAYALAAPTAEMTAWVAIYIVVVLVAGSVLTYLWVKLPSGASGERRRSAWAGVLGFFAAVPISYLALVVVFQLLLPRR